MSDIRLRTKEEQRRRGFLRAMMSMSLVCAMSGGVVGMTARHVPAEAETEAVIPAHKSRVVIYVMDEAALQLRDRDARKLDQLNVSFALIRDGEADISHWRGQKQVAAFLKKHPHVDGVLSVGGWGRRGSPMPAGLRKASSALRTASCA